jgi:hypothetical protein
MRTEKTLEECFHAALAAIHRELPDGVICGYLFQKGKGPVARRTQERATCIWQLLELESIDDFVYILSEIGIPNVKVRTNGNFQGGTELQAYIEKNKDLKSIVAVKALKSGSSSHFCFLPPNASKIADYATLPSRLKNGIIEIKDLRMELALRTKAPKSSVVSPFGPSYGEDHIKSADDGGAPPPSSTHSLPDRPRPRGVLPTFVETGHSTGMPASNDGGYVTPLFSPSDPCYGTPTQFVRGPRLEDPHSAAGETAGLPSGKPPSNDNGYAPSVSHFDSNSNQPTSTDTHDVHIIEEEAGEKQKGDTVNLNIAWDCAKHPLPKKTTDVAGQSFYIPPKYVCIPKSEYTKLQKLQKKADRFDAILDALKKKKFVGDTLSKRQLGSVMAIFASLTLVPCEVCTYILVHLSDTLRLRTFLKFQRVDCSLTFLLDLLRFS